MHCKRSGVSCSSSIQTSASMTPRLSTSNCDFRCSPRRIAAAGIGILGVLTLVLAATGLYGVLSYAVARRQREIGIRVAIGATPSHVFRTVLGRSAAVIAIGAVAGLAIAFMIGRVLAPYLYGASARDPLAFAAVGAAMTCTAALALWMPARRAIALDPTIALRAE